jgi:hypothetical protein
MSLETLKCPHCGYLYRIDIERVAEDGKIVAVRRLIGRKYDKNGEELRIDQKCPNCNKEFEWRIE